MGLRHFASQLRHFLSPDRLPELSLHPRPWQEPFPFYYLRHPLRDEDDHGGYTRLYRFDAAGVPYSTRRGKFVYDPLVVARYAMRMLAIETMTGRRTARAQAQRQLEPLVVSGSMTGA